MINALEVTSVANIELVYRDGAAKIIEKCGELIETAGGCYIREGFDGVVVSLHASRKNVADEIADIRTPHAVRFDTGAEIPAVLDKNAGRNFTAIEIRKNPSKAGVAYLGRIIFAMNHLIGVLEG